MSFDTWFKASSYATVACGAAALVVVGDLGWWMALAATAVVALAWSLEGTGWQLPERAGLFVVLLSLPLFYLDWKYLETGGGEVNAGVAALRHLTLFLSAVKLLQVKSDREWLFLYLISFFEVLLAAGRSVSPVFLLALGLYLFCALLTVICFELRRARRAAPPGLGGRVRVTFDPPRRGRRPDAGDAPRRLPSAALFLLALVFALALPIFLLTPRFGGRAAPLGADAPTAQVGFSERMALGEFGRIQRSDRLVMRVKVDGAQPARPLRWRGLSLDYFDGLTWRRTSRESQILMGGDRDFFAVGTTEDLGRLTTQTFFVEPLDTAVMFAAPRAVAVQGQLDFVRTYSDGGALTTRPHPQTRISYRVYSDTVEPAAEQLYTDARRYPREPTPNLRVPIANYLQLPADLDPGVTSLSWLVTHRAGARTRYEVARAFEAHLARNEYGGGYGYSLDRRGGGDDPISDFLFNVREGHCEYFATAMVVMLRTQGVAARVVNGFVAGEYNPDAGAYFVRQYDAHAWVEVYFPETDSWVAFDPTPAAGRPGAGAGRGLSARLRQYGEALELFWIQYVIAYDSQEQQSLASSFRTGIHSFGRALTDSTSRLGTQLSSWATDGPRAGGALVYAPALISVIAASVLLFVALRYAGRLKAARKDAGAKGAGASAVEFYERMAAVLEARGLSRAAEQTPLEFAESVGTPEVLAITRAFHRVRYGARGLSDEEAADIDRCLRRLEREAATANGQA